MNTFARHSIGLLSGLAVLTALGCGSDSTSPGSAGDDGDYRGIFSATDGITAVGGALVITIQSATASGTLTPVGLAGVPLTGTYSSSTKAVNLSGGGHTLVGTVNSSGELKGAHHGTGGDGTFATQRGTSSEVAQFCGTFAGDDTGTWNLSKRANSLVGAFASDGGDSGSLTGTLSGSSISITFSGGTAAGTLTSATAMNGTWTAGVASGTWTGNSPC